MLFGETVAVCCDNHKKHILYIYRVQYNAGKLRNILNAKAYTKHVYHVLYMFT
jgi:hypothetical protein